jgi:hypothetical protein
LWKKARHCSRETESIVNIAPLQTNLVDVPELPNIIKPSMITMEDLFTMEEEL